MVATTAIMMLAVMKNRSETPMTAMLVHQRSLDPVGEASALITSVTVCGLLMRVESSGFGAIGRV
jgi:hypothetical protein